MATEDNGSNSISLSDLLAQLERVWQRLADDPERQALETARWCVAIAPQYRVQLQAKILGTLSDRALKHRLFNRPEDGRIQALNLLAR